MGKAGNPTIGIVAATLSLAGAAHADVAEPPQTPAPSLAYWLSLSRQHAVPAATGKEARLMRMGPLKGYDFVRGVPTLAASGKVEMLISRTGPVPAVHTAQCAVEGAQALRFKQYRGGGDKIDSPVYAVTAGKIEDKVVKDGDDGKVDGLFSYDFLFGADPRDVLVVQADALNSDAWNFHSCRIMLKGFGFQDSGKIPPAEKTITPGNPYRMSIVRPTYRITQNGVTHKAGLMSGFDALGYQNFPPDGAVLMTHEPKPGSSILALRVARTGGPAQLHRLFCRTTSDGMAFQHFRPKPGVKTINALSDVTLAPFKTFTPKAPTSVQGPWKIFAYDFVFGLTGQDLIELTFTPSVTNLLDYCVVTTKAGAQPSV